MEEELLVALQRMNDGERAVCLYHLSHAGFDPNHLRSPISPAEVAVAVLTHFSGRPGGLEKLKAAIVKVAPQLIEARPSGEEHDGGPPPPHAALNHRLDQALKAVDRIDPLPGLPPAVTIADEALEKGLELDQHLLRRLDAELARGASLKEWRTLERLAEQPRDYGPTVRRQAQRGGWPDYLIGAMLLVRAGEPLPPLPSGLDFERPPTKLRAALMILTAAGGSDRFLRAGLDESGLHPIADRLYRRASAASGALECREPLDGGPPGARVVVELPHFHGDLDSAPLGGTLPPRPDRDLHPGHLSLCERGRAVVSLEFDLLDGPGGITLRVRRS